MSWRFSETDRAEDYLFNAVLERFYKSGIQGLVRENIQNSLDGKNKNVDEPVIVRIKTGKVKTSDLPSINDVKKHINALIGKSEYTIETIESMQQAINLDIVNYISFEDENTIGLSGADKGYSNDRKNTFSSYAYSRGVHGEVNDLEFEKSRGGSHGIGKIASNSASLIYLMYFANCDEYNQQHVCGNIQLIDHFLEDKYYRSTGYFTDLKDTVFHPFVNSFNGIFEKKTRGLKIVIPYLRDEFKDQNNIIRSVCDSFFLAILKESLVVYVNDTCIDSNTLKDYVYDPDFYNQDPEEMKTVFTPMYLKTYEQAKGKKIEVKDKKKSYFFNLYFEYNKSLKKGRTAVVRTVGMKIEDYKVKGYATKPYNAVLIPASNEEDMFLKSLENESHTELSSSHIKSDEKKANAKRFLNNLSKVIATVIDESIKEQNPTDAKIDTDDVLYEVETTFKNKLKKSSPAVNVNRGKRKKTLYKSGKEVRNDNSTDKVNESKDTKATMPRDRKDNQGESKKLKPKYALHPSHVKRFSSKKSEYLKIDLNEHADLKDLTKCNIQFSFVDGEGTEGNIDFKLTDAFDKVASNNSVEIVKVVEHALKNVPIKDGIIDLKFDLNDKYNHTYKFTYYLEVR